MQMLECCSRDMQTVDSALPSIIDEINIADTVGSYRSGDMKISVSVTCKLRVLLLVKLS